MSTPFDVSAFKKLLKSTESILTESVSGPEAAKHVEGQSPAPAPKAEPGEVSTEGRRETAVVGGDNTLPKEGLSAGPAGHKEGGEASSQGPRTVRSVSEWHDRMMELANLQEMTGPEAAKHVEGQSPAPAPKAPEGGQAIQQGPADVRTIGNGSGEEAAKHVEGQAKAPAETVPAEAGARSEGSKETPKTVSESISELAQYSKKMVALIG